MPPAAKTRPLPKAPKASPKASPSSSGSPSSPGSAPKGTATRSAATEGAGAFLALVLYPVLVNFLNGGPKQVAGWFKAKWINEPYSGGGKGQAPVATTRAPTPSGWNTTPPPIWEKQG